MGVAEEDLEQLANRARELEGRRDLQGALDCHLRILETQRGDPVIVFHAHGYIADLYIKMGRPADAQRHLEAALEINADDESYLYALGRVLGMQDRHDEAAEAYARAADLAPANRELHRAHAASLLAAGRLKEAEGAYLAAYHMDPGHLPTVAGLIAVLAKQGRLDEAERLLGTALESNPGDALLECARSALARLRDRR
jgi:protein O-GlcNAc transferase